MTVSAIDRARTAIGVVKKYVKQNKQRSAALAFALVIGAIGLTAMQLSNAATYVVALEAESGTVTGAASKQTSGSNASGGFVKFGDSGTTPVPTPPTPTTPPSGSYKAGFVYRQGKNLMLNGGVYKFVGFNDYSLTGCHSGSGGTPALQDQYFKGLRPASLTRTWAFKSVDRAKIDGAVKAAEKYGQKIMLTLGEGAGYCGAGNNGPAFFAGGYTGAYFSWLREIVPKYKDSPAVVWEIMNEPGQSGGAGNQAQMKKFYHDAAQLIKSLDPNHVVSVGTLDSYQSFQSGQAGYADVHNSPYIDLVSMHEYEYNYSGNTGTAGRFGQNKAAADSLNKPIFIGEFGTVPGNGCNSSAQRANLNKLKFDAYLNAGAAGVLYFATGEPGNSDQVCSAYATNEGYNSAVYNQARSYSNPNLPTPKQ